MYTIIIVCYKNNNWYIWFLKRFFLEALLSVVLKSSIQNRTKCKVYGNSYK